MGSPAFKPLLKIPQCLQNQISAPRPFALYFYGFSLCVNLIVIVGASDNVSNGDCVYIGNVGTAPNIIEMCCYQYTTIGMTRH